MNPFVWIRRKAAEAVALGVADGMRSIAPAGEEPPADLDGLRQLVAVSVDVKAIEAPAEGEPARRRGK